MHSQCMQLILGVLACLVVCEIDSGCFADASNGTATLTVRRLTSATTTEKVNAYKKDGTEYVGLVAPAWTQPNPWTSVPACNQGHLAYRLGQTETYEHSHNAFILGTTLPIGFPVYVIVGGVVIEVTESQCYNAWEVFFSDRYGVNNFSSDGHPDFSHNCHSFATGRLDHWINNIGPIQSVEYKTPDPADHSHTEVFMLGRQSNGNFIHSLKYDSESPLPSGTIKLFTKEKFLESQIIRTSFVVTGPWSPPGPGADTGDWRKGEFFRKK